MTATTIYLGGAPAAPLGQRILKFPLTRILLALAFFMVPFLLIQGGATHFLKKSCTRVWANSLGPSWAACRMRFTLSR